MLYPRLVRLALAISWLVFHVQIVVGHTFLLRSEPAPGQRLTQPPATIVLTFAEPVTAGSIISLFRQDFRPVSEVRTTIDSAQPALLVATVPVLKPGRYSVQWTAVTGDGHQIRGSYEFQVLASPQFRAEAWAAALLLSGFLVLLLVRRRRRH